MIFSVFETLRLLCIMLIGFFLGHYLAKLTDHLIAKRKPKRSIPAGVTIVRMPDGKGYSIRQGEPPFSEVIWVEQHGVGSIGLTHQDAFKLIDLFFEKEFGKQSKAEDLNLGNQTLQ